MAKKEAAQTLERIYTVPLRRESLKAPRWNRTKKAVTALRQFLTRHMKSENIKLTPELNQALWQRGIKHPPHHVKITATKDEKGVVKADLFRIKQQTPKQEEKVTSPRLEEKKA